MREERKLNRAIQKDGAETQAEILEELKIKYPQYSGIVENKEHTHNKRRVAVFSALAAVAACVAVIVPCAVLLPNSDNSGSENGYRFCAQGDYKRLVSEYTIREHSEKYDSRILYIDWYDTSEDCVTAYYVSRADNEILGLYESMNFSETCETAELAITKVDIYLGEYNVVYNYTDEQSVRGHTVKWYNTEDVYIGMVESDGYRYIIVIDTDRGETRLFELVEELLQKN